MGILFVTASGIALAFYVTEIESELKEMSQRNDLNEAQAAEWHKQAQLAIAVIDNRRAMDGNNQSALAD